MKIVRVFIIFSMLFSTVVMPVEAKCKSWDIPCKVKKLVKKMKKSMKKVKKASKPIKPPKSKSTYGNDESGLSAKFGKEIGKSMKGGGNSKKREKRRGKKKK